MAQIILYVSDHKISIDDSVLLAQDSNQYDSIKFIFDSTWDGYTSNAIMYQKIQDVISVPLKNDMCYIPSHVLKYNSPLYIGARGTNSSDTDKRVTTQMVSFQVTSGAIRGNNSTSEEIGNADYKTLMSLLNGKVNIKQGTDYSGMFLGVDSSGNVKPMDILENFEVATVDETKSYLGLT